ncbi:hypothetical protein GCM10010381_55020 [Streptomyces xantholiticus]|nr:hypothetical protein GCM10010381_55020 [Streptomyces xantholiticus]
MKVRKATVEVLTMDDKDSGTAPGRGGRRGASSPQAREEMDVMTHPYCEVDVPIRAPSPARTSQHTWSTR